MSTALFQYTLHLADDALILGQRNAEWTGHGPVLEQDIAITNIALDCLGQARPLYQFAAEQYEAFSEADKASVDALIPRTWKSFGRELLEDDLAFLRDEHQYRNHLLVELPRGDWAYTVLRQFFFSAYQHLLYTELLKHEAEALRGVAEKAVKEVAYHLRWSAEWVIRLGDGTEESHQRIRTAFTELWPFTGELFQTLNDEVEAGMDVASLKTAWYQKLTEVLTEARLLEEGRSLTEPTWFQSGGKEGRHTEYLGFLLAEMQHLQRSIPNATW